MRVVLVHPAGSNWTPGQKDLTVAANRMVPIGLLAVASYLEANGLEVLFGDVDPRDDRVEVDDVEEVLAGLDLVAEHHDACGDRAGDRCADLGVAQFALGIGEGDLKLLELVGRVGEGLLADELLIEQPLLAVVLAPGPV